MRASIEIWNRLFHYSGLVWSMRRSSWFILLAALAILLTLAALYVLQNTAEEPPMSEEAARQFVSRGVQRFNAGDMNGLLALFAPDARVLGQPMHNLKKALNRATHEMGSARLRATTANVRAVDAGTHWIISTDLTVDEQRPDADIQYFRSKVTAELRKSRTSSLFGLRETEAWKIAAVRADPEIHLPDF